MINNFTATEDTGTKYVVCYNEEAGIYHFSIVEPGQTITSGQPGMQIFDTKEDVVFEFPNLQDIVFPSDEGEL